MATRMTIGQIVDAIAAVNATIPGINASYGQNLPSQFTIFPAAFVLLGPDDWTKFGPTEFWIHVLVAPVASQGNVSLVYQQCLNLSQLFHDAYSLNFSTIGDRYIHRSHVSTKMGFGSTGFAYTLKWAKAEFYGFTVNLPLAPTIPGV